MKQSKREALQDKIAELTIKVEELSQQVEQLPEEETKQWEPKGGEWFIKYNGEVGKSVSINDKRLYGVEFQTEIDARKASSKMRAFNRCYQAHQELVGDWRPNRYIERYYVLWSQADKDLYIDIFYATAFNSFPLQSRGQALQFIEMVSDELMILLGGKDG